MDRRTSRSHRVVDRKAFAFTLFDTDGSGGVDASELSKLVIQCFNDKLRAQRGSQWSDGSKDPVVDTMSDFVSTIHREHPATLDFEAFNGLLMKYASLFEPAFAMWAALAQYSVGACLEDYNRSTCTRSPQRWFATYSISHRGRTRLS